MAKAKVAKGSSRSKVRIPQAGQQSKTGASKSPETEKAGRLYALAMLKALDAEGYEKMGADADGEATTDFNGKTALFSIYRTEPQTMPARKWIEDLHKYGTPDAIAGFYVVLSEFFALHVGGMTPDTAGLCAVERRGGFSPAGSVIYTHPKEAAAAIAAGKDEYEVELSAEEVKRRAKEKAQADKRRASMESAPPIERFSQSVGTLNTDAATLAGVVDVLRGLVMTCDEANIVGMLANVVDGVNERMSAVALELSGKVNEAAS